MYWIFAKTFTVARKYFYTFLYFHAILDRSSGQVWQDNILHTSTSIAGNLKLNFTIFYFRIEVPDFAYSSRCGILFFIMNYTAAQPNKSWHAIVLDELNISVECRWMYGIWMHYWIPAMSIKIIPSLASSPLSQAPVGTGLYQSREFSHISNHIFMKNTTCHWNFPFQWQNPNICHLFWSLPCK